MFTYRYHPDIHLYQHRLRTSWHRLLHHNRCTVRRNGSVRRSSNQRVEESLVYGILHSIRPQNLWMENENEMSHFVQHSTTRHSL